MSRIRNSDTRPEKQVRSLLHRLGYRFRLGTKGLFGRPDIVLSKHKTVVFVHGCFWHRHEGCRDATTPKSNTDFWTDKFVRNVQRDEMVKSYLANAGWNVVVVWECELRDMDSLAQRLRNEIKRITE